MTRPAFRYWVTCHRVGLFVAATVWSKQTGKTGSPEVVAEELAIRTKTAVRKAKATIVHLQSFDQTLADNLAATEPPEKYRQLGGDHDA